MSKIHSFQRTPIYRCQLVRDGSTKTQPRLNSSERAREVAAELLKDSPNEQFVAILLDTKLKIIGATVITVGTLDASLVHPREVFRPAIISNSSAVIVAHNHPSGDLTPSTEDWSVYETLQKAGKVLGINVLDSLIVNFEGESYSMAQKLS